MKSLMAIFVATILLSVSSPVFAEKAVETLTHSIYSEKIQIQVAEIEPYVHVIKLNENIIHRDEGNFSLRIETFLSSFGIDGQSVLLIGGSAGGSGSGIYYRLIQINQKKQVRVTKVFGTGVIPIMTVDNIKGIIIFEFPKGATKTGIGGRKVTAEVWIFENGNLKNSNHQRR
jgi:hypothetical protein